MIIEVKRVHENLAGTFGVLSIDNTPFALTLENTWMDNARNLSCIPQGSYTARRVDSPKFGDTFEITNVPGRSHILFHKGNTDEDTSGCILVAEEYGSLNGGPAILSSSKGFGEFKDLTKDVDSFQLVIRDLTR